MNLGGSYYERIRGDRADNLEKAIEHTKLALEVYSQETLPFEWAKGCFNLGVAHSDRIRGERADNLEEAVKQYQAALTVLTREAFPEMWARAMVNLGNVYTQRTRGNAAENLERALDQYKRALVIFSRDAFPWDWAFAQERVGTAYRERIQGERADNLEQAIMHYQQALEVDTPEAFPEDWALLQTQMGNAYRVRILGDRADNIEQAIACHSRALEVRTRNASPVQWARTQINLGAAYSERIRGVRADNLERAMEHLEDGATILTREAFPEDWGKAQNNLGYVYSQRIRGERADNLERAIEHYEAAVEVRTPDAFRTDWAMTHMNIGVTYSERIRGDRAENLEQAISHHRAAQAILTRVVFPQRWAMCMANQATAFAMRIRGNREDNQEEALASFERSLEVFTREAFPEDWAKAQDSLGSVYLERARGVRADNLEQAITHFRRASEVRTQETFPVDWAMTQCNLGIAYIQRIQGDRAENLAQAVSYFHSALGMYNLDHFPGQHRALLRNLGEVYFGEQKWHEAYGAFSEAMKAGENIMAVAYTETGRRAEAGEISRLHAQTAFCLLKLRQLAEALLAFERGKARLLSEALSLADADIAVLPNDLKGAMSEARTNVRIFEAEMRMLPRSPGRRTDAELSGLLHQARSDLKKLIESVRKQYPDFMPSGLEWDEIIQMIPEDGAIVAPLLTSQGGVVFILPHGMRTLTEENVIWLEDFDENALSSMLAGTNSEPGWLQAYHLSREGWKRSIEAFTARLWNTLLSPIHDGLKKIGVKEGAPITFLPDSGLGLLPLHAAWRERNGSKRAFVDDFAVAYTPSVHALSISQRRVRALRGEPLALLAIINPTGDLSYAQIEGETVAALFSPDAGQLLTEKDATRSAVLEAAPRCHYLHFACHGFFDLKDVMRSGLRLAGKDVLTLSDVISDLALRSTRLVTLSACETGLTEFWRTPDEYIGLPAGFLLSGAAGVVSTLWSVDDLATSLLMDRFYREHLQGGAHPSNALRAAQLWLRDATRDELNEYYRSHVRPGLGEPARTRGDRALSDERGTRNERVFANPFFWAPFIFTGA
jgi:CHAT domain-containing protein/tetratricopeptide (TPR) repeat protein